jgi:hypothetical protein
LLVPSELPREPYPTRVDVVFRTPDETHACDMVFDFESGRYEIDLSPGPDDPAEIIVQPFTVKTACRDVIQLTDSVAFERDGGDYAVPCPDSM